MGGRVITHGHARRGSKSSTYRSWVNMRNRCRYDDHEHWEYYGGRGITVCQRWERFANFLSDMGPRPDGMTIDRIDHDRGYEPGNCRWASNEQQLANRRRYSKGKAAQTHCIHGHLFDEANTKIRSNGTRECRQCSSRRSAHRRSRKAMQRETA